MVRAQRASIGIITLPQQESLMSTVMGVGPGGAVAHAPADAAGLASRVMVLLFTDVAGSTQLKEKLGMPAYARLISRHDALFKSVVDATRGADILQDTGDGFLARFVTPSDAVTAALRFQLGLTGAEWGDTPLRVRIGLHMGQMTELEPTARGNGSGGHAKVVGVGADMASRVMRLAVPGQILMTRGAFDEARQYLRQRPPAVVGTSVATPESASDATEDVAPYIDPSADPLRDAQVTVPTTHGDAHHDADPVPLHDDLPPLEWVAHGRYVIAGPCPRPACGQLRRRAHARLAARRRARGPPPAGLAAPAPAGRRRVRRGVACPQPAHEGPARLQVLLRPRPPAVAQAGADPVPPPARGAGG
jgi:class 3 adenylate cyclase